MPDIAGDLTTTTFLLPGQPLTSDIGFLGDLDVVETALSNGLAYGFSATTTDPALDIDLLLLDSGGGQIGRDVGSNGGKAAFSVTAGATDTFFVQIGDNNGADTRDYTLVIDADDTIVNSVQTTEIIASGTCLVSEIDVSGDIDVIGIELVAGVTYEFRAFTRSNVLDLDLQLLYAGGGLQVRQVGSNGDTVSVSFTAVTTERFLSRSVTARTMTSGTTCFWSPRVPTIS